LHLRDQQPEAIGAALLQVEPDGPGIWLVVRHRVSSMLPARVGTHARSTPVRPQSCETCNIWVMQLTLRKPAMRASSSIYGPKFAGHRTPERRGAMTGRMRLR